MEQFNKNDEHSSSDDDSSCGGPLYKLADLISQLPVKRGLSKFYNGKSESFASLSNLKSNEDLGKDELRRRRKRMKPCKSYKVGPKATITKTSPKILYHSPSFNWY